MPTVDVYNVQQQKIGSLDLSDAVFGAPVREHLYYEVVRMQLAGRRSGTACTKGRAEVAYSTKKLYRQKGTGRARRGSRRSPTMRGGGTVFGPKPRSYYYRVPKSMRRAALISALSGRVAEGRLLVLDDFALARPRTKDLAKMLTAFGAEKALVVDQSGASAVKLSARNLPRAKYLAPEGVNTFDVLKYDHLVISQSAVRAVEEALTR